MKITGVEILPVDVPLDHAWGAYTAVSVAVARVRTNQGIEGLGHLMALNPRHFRSMMVALEELSELVIGQDPSEPERIYSKLSPGGSWSGSGGIPTQATAALDIAVWDLAGKAAGLPLWRLLGGFRNRVPAYATTRLPRNLPLDTLARTAAELVEEGFHTIKMNLGGQGLPAAEAERARTVREAVGPNIGIMADVNSMWTPAHAIRVGHAIEEYQLFWLEDPVPIHDVPGLAEICRALDTPIATGETVYGFPNFRPLFEARALDIPMPDLMRVGGVTPFRKAAHMAEAFGLPVANHLLWEVSTHLIAAVPNGLIVEHNDWSSKVFSGCPVLDKGDLVLSDRPGTGLEIDQSFVDKHRIDAG
jgi:L-alanine-DL-glutamate epimerase-like enolase superfamily enzyme